MRFRSSWTYLCVCTVRAPSRVVSVLFVCSVCATLAPAVVGEYRAVEAHGIRRLWRDQKKGGL
ncbi:MAG: hypothetical protein RSB74_03095, partial [Kiritimatiellia bacterium]